MPCFQLCRLIFLTLLAGLLISLNHARGQQTAPPTKPAPPAPAGAKGDPEAVKLLAQAMERLDAKHIAWLETSVSQKVNVQGLTYRAEGRYVSGPDRRLCLDLTVHLAGTKGHLLVVCDGTTVWNLQKIGNDAQAIMTWDLKSVQQVLNSPGTVPQFGEDFFRSQAFSGVQPLLQVLSTQMTFSKPEKGSWNKHEVYKITGTWNPDIRKMLTGQDNSWQPGMPRTCSLYLDRESYWPRRLEWLGPVGGRAPDTDLMQIEFRDPHIYKPGEHPPENLSDAFKFTPPKDTKVVDRTKEFCDQLAQQAHNRPAAGR
jgi:hypothetical protein